MSMVEPSVLIVGQLPDPHIEAVECHLRDLGAEVWIFDRARPESERLVQLTFGSGKAEGKLILGDRVCTLESLTAVWWRVKPYAFTDIVEGSRSLAAGFAEREWRSVLDGIEMYNPEATWINPRSADIMARNKPWQLQVAMDLGFVIPPTLISNHPQAIGDFIDDPSTEFVYKVLTWYVEPPDKMIFTSPIMLSDVSANPDSIERAPGIFQSRIPKAYEVRATVVGNEILAAHIDSQALVSTALDWRHDQTSLSYRKWILPDDVAQRLIEMNRRLGLEFGAYDLIVTPDGEYVFLEVNPLGQWLWIEQRTGLPVSRTLAERLCA